MKPSSWWRRLGRLISVVLLLGLLAASLWAVVNRQWVVDWLAAQQFQLSADLQTVSDKLSLTQSAELILKASQPSLQTKQQFNHNCPRREASSYVLGCYNGQQIFVFNVQHPELKGINEVTLAHELLHAVYRRLSPAEKQQLGQELRANYQRLKTDELTSRMAMYERTQPGEFENELYSILPTEFSDLSPALERHYQRYFQQRQLIVEAHHGYRESFLTKQRQAETLKQQLQTQEADFQTAKVIYQTQLEQLNQQIADFNQKNQQRRFTSRAEFDQARRGLLARQGQLRQRQTELNRQVASINQLIERYNQQIVVLDNLNNQLDSLADSAEVQ